MNEITEEQVKAINQAIDAFVLSQVAAYHEMIFAIELAAKNIEKVLEQSGFFELVSEMRSSERKTANCYRFCAIT